MLFHLETASLIEQWNDLLRILQVGQGTTFQMQTTPCIAHLYGALSPVGSIHESMNQGAPLNHPSISHFVLPTPATLGSVGSNVLVPQNANYSCYLNTWVSFVQGPGGKTRSQGKLALIRRKR